MVLGKNLIAASVKLPLLTWAHIPRRRKRHYFKSKMSVLLLIFVSCCLTLIFYPLNVQANDLDATSSKDGNMLAYDHRSKSSFSTDNVLDEGEENAKTDKANDNGIFEKIQQQKKLENKNADGDISEEEKQHSSEIIEMLQPLHILRHREHFKQQQQQQNDAMKQNTRKHFEYQHEQQQNYDINSDIDDDLYDDDYDDDDDDDGNDKDKNDGTNDDEEHNRRLRYQQIQEALREPITPPTPHHHRRHEHHLEKKRLSQQMELKLMQHHLRHQHRQNKEFHSKRQQNITNYSGLRTKYLHQRYFDRQSSYSSPFVSTATTEGPHVHLPPSNRYSKSIANEYLINPHNQLFNDNANANAIANADANTNTNIDIDMNQEKDIKRFSLPLGENVNDDIDRDNRVKETAAPLSKEEDDVNYDITIDDYGANEDTDYSYEDDDKEENKRNKYPSIPSTTSKTNVKRYSNPLRLSNKPNRHMENNQKVKNLAHHRNNFKLNTNDDDYDDKDVIKTSTFASVSSLLLNASDASEASALLKENDDVRFSEEKWRQIEYEHYRKQLQHQRDMQALRYRRPINENSSPPYRYSSYSAASVNPSLIHSNSWTKRQTVNNDHDDNIYSRYYVPGIMTQKKEEELGSPKAILESRRQYAIQQRQNKALASAHHRRIVTEGFCRMPQPRVERIRRDSWKIYTPHCTILHRCADDAGCCPSERQTCAPKRTKTVELYFFVISLNETQGSIEKLTFVNHTECHCIERSKQRAPEYGNSRTKELLTYNQIPYLRRATILNCYCPNLFEKILQEDGYCRCDCSSGNMGCDWLKRGMEHFSMNDRKCITEGRCKLPTCEYGQYIKKHGRCPRREERHLSADVDW